MSKKYTYALLLVILIAIQANAQNPVELKSQPLNIQLQYAGNVGLVSIGVGKHKPYNKLNFCVIYGYLPKIINEATVHTLALKSSFKITETRISPIHYLNYYTGITVLYGITRNTFLDYPDYFPDGYYMTNAIHFSPYLGLKLNANTKKSSLRTLSFFTELGTLDYKLWSALSTRYVGLFDIWNISLGIAFTLN